MYRRPRLGKHTRPRHLENAEAESVTTPDLMPSVDGFGVGTGPVGLTGLPTHFMLVKRVRIPPTVAALLGYGKHLTAAPEWPASGHQQKVLATPTLATSITL
jgi:hypothetical protein